MVLKTYMGKVKNGYDQDFVNLIEVCNRVNPNIVPANCRGEGVYYLVREQKREKLDFDFNALTDIGFKVVGLTTYQGKDTIIVGKLDKRE
jgi:hypothetical protein